MHLGRGRMWCILHNFSAERRSAAASTLHGVSGLDPARDDLGNDTRLKVDVWRLSKRPVSPVRMRHDGAKPMDVAGNELLEIGAGK